MKENHGFRLLVGQYCLAESAEHGYFLGNTDGETMVISEAELERLLDEYFKVNF